MPLLQTLIAIGKSSKQIQKFVNKKFDTMGNLKETLIIKNFPSSLTDEDKTRFLSKCGAVSVKVLSSKINRYHAVFARFPTASIAQRVLHQLHQQDVMGNFLTVEYARGQEKKECLVKETCQVPCYQNETGSEVLLKRFLEKLNSWTSGSNFRSPVPSNLRYHYPPPTRATLKNIEQQLSSVPWFYTQVLHLMNKMNLPCPFSNDEAELQGDKTTPIKEVERDLLKNTTDDAAETESESELSSDEENKHKEAIPLKLPAKPSKINRPIVLKKIISAPLATARKHKYEDVFDDPKDLVEPKPKKTKEVIKERPAAEMRQEAPGSPTGFGYIFPAAKPSDPPGLSEGPIRNEMEEERTEREVVSCITAEALTSNRIPEKDRAVLPVYKNYAEGAPTCRLYVKNLAKQTSVDNLKFIYSRYMDYTEPTAPNIFDIRLMQEGRMKGQAFITLQTVELAKKALAETNGYILNDKPMVVQFARSAVK